jgi:hypothetical protein
LQARLYPSVRAFVVTFPIVTIAGVEFHWACARLNNSVIRGTNTVSGKFKRNDDMEVLMRTYILAIATARQNDWVVALDCASTPSAGWRWMLYKRLTQC